MGANGSKGIKRASSEADGSGTPARKKQKQGRNLGRTLSELDENPTASPLVVLMFTDDAKDPLHTFDLSQVYFAISQTTAKEVGGQPMVFVKTTFVPEKEGQAPKWISNMYTVSEGVAVRLELPEQQVIKVWPRNEGLDVKSGGSQAARHLWETTLNLLLGDKQVTLRHNDPELGPLPANYLTNMKQVLVSQKRRMKEKDDKKADELKLQRQLNRAAKKSGADDKSRNDEAGGKSRNDEAGGKSRNDETGGKSGNDEAGGKSGNDEAGDKSGKKAANGDSGGAQRPTESGPGLPTRTAGRTPTAGPRQDYVWTATLSLVVPREQTAEGGNPAKRRKLQRQPTERYRWDDPRLLDLKQEADRRLRACYANNRDHRNWRGGPDNFLIEEHQAQLKFMWIYAMNEHRDGEDRYLNFLERWGFRAVWQAELVAKGLVPENA